MLAMNGFSRKFGISLLGITTLLVIVGSGYFYYQSTFNGDELLITDWQDHLKLISVMLLGAFLTIVRDLFTDKNEFTHDKVMSIIDAVNGGKSNGGLNG